MSDPIHQEISLAASPARIYQTLTSGDAFGAFTGAPAEIASEEGGAFSCFGGQIVGRNIELVPERRIVQAWRVGAWEDGVYSVVKFELSEHGKATSLALHHSGFPEAFRGHLEDGWHTMYWGPLKTYLS